MATAVGLLAVFWLRNDPREDTPHRNQRETHMVPKGGIRVLEKTRGAGKIEGRR